MVVKSSSFPTQDIHNKDIHNNVTTNTRHQSPSFTGLLSGFIFLVGYRIYILGPACKWQKDNEHREI